MKHKVESKQFLNAVGNKLQSLRQEQNKAPETVAKAVNISPELLLSIEEGDHDLPLDLLIELCEVYEVAPYDFFKEVTSNLRV